MAFLSDFGRFLLAVISRWQAYITGSFFAAVGFLYEHLSGKLISRSIALWGAAVFFVTGAFMAWRDEYRSDRPIEIRERLDAYLRQGEKLLDHWTKKRRPKIRTNSWNRHVVGFVKKHFDVHDYDYFRSNVLSDDKLEVEIALKLAPSPGEQSHSYDNAQLLGARLEALKQLRRKIRES